MTRNDDSYDARVDRVFVALGRMSEPDLVGMRAAWEGGDASTREQAWSKVRATERRDPRARILANARNRLSSWASEAYISWQGGSTGSVIVPGLIDEAELRRGAQPPALDAIAAVLFDDVLDDDEREELLEPIRRVTEPEPAE